MLTIACPSVHVLLFDETLGGGISDRIICSPGVQLLLSLQQQSGLMQVMQNATEVYIPGARTSHLLAYAVCLALTHAPGHSKWCAWLCNALAGCTCLLPGKFKNAFNDHNDYLLYYHVSAECYYHYYLMVLQS